MKTKVYSTSDVRRIVEAVGLDALMDEAIDNLTRACRDFDPDVIQVPVRDGFEYSLPDTGLIEWMPAMQSGGNVVIKVVGYHPANPATRALPTILSTVMIFDTASGHLLAVLDGTFLTALRTGAASAVASRILAATDSRVLGMIGCGAQAVTQLHALSRVFELEQVLVYDLDPAASASFAARTARFNSAGIPVTACDLQHLVGHADILCTATSVDVGAGPVFGNSPMQERVHINAVGSDFPGKFELPLALLRRCLVCPDFAPQAVREGECQQLDGEPAGPDLPELVKGADQYARHRARSTVFDSTGWAYEDFVIALMLCAHGDRIGCGSETDLAGLSADPHDPYAFLHPGAAPGVAAQIAALQAASDR